MNSFLFDSILGTVFTKLFPFVVPLTFLLSVLLFSDRLIDLFQSIVKQRRD